MNIKELQEKYLGKKISVPYKGHPMCKNMYEDARIGGICDFIGINEHIPEWGLQVTIGRMPLSNVDPLTIKLLE